MLVAKLDFLQLLVVQASINGIISWTKDVGSTVKAMMGKKEASEGISRS